MTGYQGNQGMGRKFISYERFSYGKQEAGASLERQTEAIQRAAKEEGLPIDDSLCLKDKGVSAFRGRNWRKGNLGKFLDLCEAQVIQPGSVLCIERVNRLSREPWRKQVALWSKILEYGVVIRLCEPPMRITNETVDALEVNTPLSILMNLAHDSSKEKSEWVKDAIRRKRKKAAETGQPHGLRCPSWLQPVGHPHPDDPTRLVVERWEVIEERKTIIRFMHELCWEGNGIVSIIHKLESKGIKSWRKDGRWTHSSVGYHLSTRALIGESVPNDRNYKCKEPKVVLVNQYPPILTDDEFERTQTCLRKRRGKGGRKSVENFNLFSHLVKSREGEPLALRSSTRPDGKKYLYLSPENMAYAIPYDRFQSAVLEMLCYVRVEDIDGSDHRDEHTAEIEKWQTVVSQKQLALDTLDRQLRELPPERWPQGAVRLQADLEDELKEASQQLREAKEKGNTSTRSEALVGSQAIASYLASITDPEAKRQALLRLKRLLPLVVEEITVVCEITNRKNKWFHIRVAYYGGKATCYSLEIGKPAPASPEFCRGW